MFLLRPYLRRAHARAEKRWAREVERCVTVDHLRQVMENRVPPIVREYYRGGADDEITLRDNVEAFRRERFKPRSGVRLESVDMRTEILGHEIELPVIAGPIGSPRMIWPLGEAVAARAVGEAGTICTLSTLTGTDLEEVRAATGGPCWFQLYLVGGEEVAARGIARAKSAGYSAIVLTIDTAVPGNRAHHEWMGASRAINGTPGQKLAFAPQMLRHLSWLKSYYSDGGMMQFRNVILKDGTPMPYTDIGTQLRASAVTWEHIPWVREHWGDAPIVIKGVQCVEDARLAVEHGADAIVVSNHGGRQLDRVYPTLYMLKEIAPALKGSSVKILLDGGIRSGADAVIALAHGAHAVLAGRAYTYGLGAGGLAGVRKAFSIMRKEIEDTMRLLGCASVHDLRADTHLLPHPFEARLEGDRDSAAATAPAGLPIRERHLN
ncbi:MAG: alpha-hydroxy acid oxidase [Deltaproteobacteria bacterium]|nr:alpha-hydroxy acid oxidase [Deltaproteobacteria bacterium]